MQSSIFYQRDMLSRKKQTNKALREIRTGARYSNRQVKNKAWRSRKTLVKGAEGRLKQFRQASALAVAITGFLLLISGPADSFPQGAEGETTTEQVTAPARAEQNEKATDEAIDALQNLWSGFVFNYPKVLIAIVCLLLAWLLARLVKAILRNTLSKVDSSAGIITLSVIAVWVVAIGVAFSVVAGDIRALAGSFGLIGLALSWALQAPIESFTGWLMNSFRGYYKVGDRISVGEVFGDVYKIDFLSTTVWEIGSPFQPGFVSAEQSTGRLVTFPNKEILTGTVTNLTGDFPYVWDELVLVVANESSLAFTIEKVAQTAAATIGSYMEKPALDYKKILNQAGISEKVSSEPQIFIAAGESWTDVIVRYLVGVKERRKWKTRLLLDLSAELGREEYQNKIIPVYPRQQLQFINTKGQPLNPEAFAATRNEQ